MKVPVVRGVIERRVLLNYRVDPGVLSAVLPPPFRPQLVGAHGIAGICLIRLAHVRPWSVPALLGVGSENAAHRIAVEWDEGGRIRTGVYIPRRDSSSPLNVLIGGRLFPGVHHRAHFDVEEQGDGFHVALRSDDGHTRVAVTGHIAPALSADSVFASLEEASDFFEGGAVGYSATARAAVFDGLELRSFGWRVEPVKVEHVESSFFDDPLRFPPGSVAFDCALLMRDIHHEWHSLAPLCAQRVVAPTA